MAKYIPQQCAVLNTETGEFIMPATQGSLSLLATTIGSTLLTLGLMAASVPASSAVFMSTSGGGSCKPAYGASTKFLFTEQYALNIGTTDQYLVCSFTNWDVNWGSQHGQSIESLTIFFDASATGGTAACTTKMGYWWGEAFNASISTKSLVLAAGEKNAIYFDDSDLRRDWEYETLTMSCKLPAGFRLGLIQRREPEPVSGSGWTP